MCGREELGEFFSQFEGTGNEIHAVPFSFERVGDCVLVRGSVSSITT